MRLFSQVPLPGFRNERKTEMTLRHRHTTISAVVLAIVCELHNTAQTQAPASESLRFEVASLKPSQPDAQGPSIIRPSTGNQGYLGTNMPLRAYLMIVTSFVTARSRAPPPGLPTTATT